MNQLADKIIVDPINALILAGGRSIRMGRDKSKLNYGYENLTLNHSFNNQIDFLHWLLRGVEVDEIFVSCRAAQKKEPHLSKYNLLFDHEQVAKNGPLTGILSALMFEKVSWLVIACDIPHIDLNLLKLLITRRQQVRKLAYTYLNETYNRIEPLCTIYQPEILKIALNSLKKGIKCPQKLLWNLEEQIDIIILPDEEKLNNINTPEDFQKAKEIFQTKFQD